MKSALLLTEAGPSCYLLSKMTQDQSESHPPQLSQILVSTAVRDASGLVMQEVQTGSLLMLAVASKMVYHIFEISATLK